MSSEELESERSRDSLMVELESESQDRFERSLSHYQERLNLLFDASPLARFLKQHRESRSNVSSPVASASPSPSLAASPSPSASLPSPSLLSPMHSVRRVPLSSPSNLRSPVTPRQLQVMEEEDDQAVQRMCSILESQARELRTRLGAAAPPSLSEESEYASMQRAMLLLTEVEDLESRLNREEEEKARRKKEELRRTASSRREEGRSGELASLVNELKEMRSVTERLLAQEEEIGRHLVEVRRRRR